MGAKTREEAQRAKEEAAPAYLRRRVKKGDALPLAVLEGRSAKGWGELKDEREEGEKEAEDEAWAVCEHLVHYLGDDLYTEMMKGLPQRKEPVSEEGGGWAQELRRALMSRGHGRGRAWGSRGWWYDAVVDDDTDEEEEAGLANNDDKNVREG